MLSTNNMGFSYITLPGFIAPKYCIQGLIFTLCNLRPSTHTVSSHLIPPDIVVFKRDNMRHWNSTIVLNFAYADEGKRGENKMG